ncbi:isochorismatase family cysteine hydrolase [Vagococcus sp. JNUCC 83]
MKHKSLVVIDIQNDITKNYKEVIHNINNAVDWAFDNKMRIIYIKHEDVSPKARYFKPNTFGAELTPDLKVVSKNIFTKNKQNALTCEDFKEFIDKHQINEFYIAGGDACFCIKSTCYNLRKNNFQVTVLTDCITSYDKSKMHDMLFYYESKGCHNTTLNDILKEKGVSNEFIYCRINQNK